MPFKKNTCCQQCVNGRKFDARWLTKEINSPYASHAFLIKKDPFCNLRHYMESSVKLSLGKMPLVRRIWCQQCVNGLKSDVRWLTKETNSLNTLNAFLIKKDPYCICEAL